MNTPLFEGLEDRLLLASVNVVFTPTSVLVAAGNGGAGVQIDAGGPGGTIRVQETIYGTTVNTVGAAPVAGATVNLKIKGGTGDDAFLIDGSFKNIDVKAGGGNDAVRAGWNGTLTVAGTFSVDGGAGDDSLSLGIASVAKDTTFIGGAGDDMIIIGSGAGGVALNGSLNVSAGTGNDAVELIATSLSNAWVYVLIFIVIIILILLLLISIRKKKHSIHRL